MCSENRKVERDSRTISLSTSSLCSPIWTEKHELLHIPREETKRRNAEQEEPPPWGQTMKALRRARRTGGSQAAAARKRRRRPREFAPGMKRERQ